MPCIGVIKLGLNIRRSVKIGKNTRLNISKSGVGVGTGVKGARVSVGPHGVRQTVGIPGTGIYYTKQQGRKKQSSPGIQGNPQTVIAKALFKLTIIAIVIALILSAIGLWPISILIVFAAAAYIISVLIKMVKAAKRNP